MTATTASASEMTFEFNSPAFNGVGYSSHVLTIEQLEANRRQKIKDDEQAEIEKAERDYKSTNAYKFRNNLESGIAFKILAQTATTSSFILSILLKQPNVTLPLVSAGNGATSTSTLGWVKHK